MLDRLRASGLQLLGELQRVPDALGFEIAARDPEKAQTELLQRVMRENGDSDFGRRHRLGEVRSLRDLQSRVPVQTYADVEPWIRRQMNGETNVLSKETPVFFASSTGTTGAPKRTPTTPTFRREFQRTVFVSMAQVAARFPAAFTGQVIYFVGPRELDRAPCGTPIGYTSGFNFTTLPPMIKKLYAWPYELFEVKDLDARTYLSAWLAAMSPVTFVAAIFPLALLHVLRAVEGFAEPLARDLRNGTLRDDIALTEKERAFFTAFAKRDVLAADRIESAGRSGSLPVSAVMPHLKLVYCWIGASASYYVPELKRRLGEGVAVRDAIYAANEAWGNVTFGEDVLGGPVAITSHVFELVAEGKEEGTLPHDLVVGDRYRILATTGAGLCRYDLGDLVECTGYYRKTPRIRFVGRAGASLSIAGEKLDERHVTQAVARALAAAGLEAAFFTAVPQYLPRPRWRLAIELTRDLDDAALSSLRDAIDRALGEEADDYRVYRKSTLGPLSLVVLERGEHDRTRRALIAKGGQDAQLKVQNLLVDPEALAGYRISRELGA